MQAALRLDDMNNRAANAARAGVQALCTGQVFAVCMEPMFEILISLCEDVAIDIFKLRRRPPGWPTDWPGRSACPDIEIIQKAILAARKTSPRPSVFGKIRGDIRNNKHEWGELMLREILTSPKCLARVQSHALSGRLIELLSVNRV